MKKLLTPCIFLLLVSTAFGQVSKPSFPDSTVSILLDSTIKVSVIKEAKSSPAFFLSGKFMYSGTMNFLDPEMIKSINVVNENCEHRGTMYYGKVLLEMKEDYKPVLMSLREIVKKYVKVEVGKTLFMLKEKVLDVDLDEVMVDEKYIFKIEIQQLVHQDLSVVKILTKTKEIIEKSKIVRIRGTELNQTN
ncbi:MAG: hypothetical protein ACOVOW_17425 [Spirosomataceae bacterium]